jgi:hypothetical protein
MKNFKMVCPPKQKALKKDLLTVLGSLPQAHAGCILGLSFDACNKREGNCAL